MDVATSPTPAKNLSWGLRLAGFRVDLEQPVQRVVLVREIPVKRRRRVVLRLPHGRHATGQPGSGEVATQVSAAVIGSRVPRDGYSAAVTSHGPRRALTST